MPVSVTTGEILLDDLFVVRNNSNWRESQRDARSMAEESSVIICSQRTRLYHLGQ